MIRRRILFGVLLVVLFAVGWRVGRGRASGGLYSNLDLFVEVLHAVQTNYVDPVETRQLVEGGMRGMLQSLDPYSAYYDEKQFKDLRASLDGDFEGVGAYFDLHEGWPYVVAPIEGGPAWKAGLRRGDVILRIDGRSTYGTTLDALAAKLGGPAGTAVKLGVAREGQTADFDVNVTRELVVRPSVTAVRVTPGGVGYLRLSVFDGHTARELRAAVDSLRRGGAKSLVLDLRGNPGGLVDQAVAAAGVFLPANTLVVSTRARRADGSQKLSTPKDAAPVAWPLAVLVDGGTASAAEVLVAALQDLDRALVVGSPSYGKGVVQSIFPLRNRAGAIKFTTSYYYSPSGRSIHRRAASAAADDAEDDGTAPDSAAADSTPKPSFRTRAGRTVLGSSGITPDVAAPVDSAATAVAAAPGGAPPALDLDHDPAFQRAADVLRCARGAADVFALAQSLPKAAAPAPAKRLVPSPHGRSGSR